MLGGSIYMVTKEEAMKCNTFHYGECTRAIGPNGGEKIDIIKWRASGKCKTWKRNPLKFSLPIKFGLYRSSYLTQENSDLFHSEENCPLKRKEIKENNTYSVFTWNEPLSTTFGKVPCTHCGRKTNVGDIVQIVFEEEEASEDKIKKLFCRDHLNKVGS